ncbi:DUF1761 domain-containing protein [Amaricoccus tamworthensis]|uniref:DUF1761 domain-containing protein n=1 Tax=Amaricoccus tamworthensis TaxID=57002 RepID=UPI003C7A3D46
MESTPQSIDWLAVLAGTILAFLLGWLWYSPVLFGKKWAEGVGVSLGSANDMPKQAMIFQLAGTFFLALVIGLTTAAGTPATTFLVILTIGCLIAANGFFAQKSHYAIVVETTFIAAMGLIMVLCQTIL